MTKQPEFPEPGRALNPGNDTARIAAALRSTSAVVRDESAHAAPLSVHALEAVIRARALRLAHLPADLLGEPAWDMLLELLHAEITGRRISAPMLCEAAGVQAGTGRRWIGALQDSGLCACPAAGGDIRLTAHGSRSLRTYFAEVTGQSSMAAPDDAS